MKGTFFDNSDINLRLTREEFNFVCSSMYEPAKNKSLVCRLQKRDGSNFDRKVNLQCQDFKSCGDGTKVDYHKATKTYFVKINEHVIFDSLDISNHFETRYGNSFVISIDISRET